LGLRERTMRSVRRRPGILALVLVLMVGLGQGCGAPRCEDLDEKACAHRLDCSPVYEEGPDPTTGQFHADLFVGCECVGTDCER
jgi:hypothetical protein